MNGHKQYVNKARSMQTKRSARMMGLVAGPPWATEAPLPEYVESVVCVHER